MEEENKTFRFDERYYGTPIPLNIGKALHENNTIQHAFYEVIANALDGGAGILPDCKFNDESNILQVINTGRFITPDHFRVGSGRNPHSIHGQHGFGMKDYLATFIRLGFTVFMESGEFKYTFELQHSPLGEVIVLFVNPRQVDGQSGSTSLESTIVSIQAPLDYVGLSEQFEKAKQQFIAFLPMKPIVSTDCIDVYPYPLDLRGKLDYIFINGAQKTVPNYSLKYVYDFKGIGEKDKKLIDLEHNAKFRQMKIYEKLRSFVHNHPDLFDASTPPLHCLEIGWMSRATNPSPSFKDVPKLSPISIELSSPPAAILPVDPSPPKYICKTTSVDLLGKILNPELHIRSVLKSIDSLLQQSDLSLSDLSLITVPPESCNKYRGVADQVIKSLKTIDGVSRVELVGSLSRSTGVQGFMDIDVMVVLTPYPCNDGLTEEDARRVCHSSCSDHVSADHTEIHVSQELRHQQIKQALICHGAEIYLDCDQLIKCIVDTLSMDVVFVNDNDLDLIDQFVLPVEIQKFSSLYSGIPVSRVVLAIKYLYNHVKQTIPFEKRLKSVLLEYIVMNEWLEMENDNTPGLKQMNTNEKCQELFYRTLTFILSQSTSISSFSSIFPRRTLNTLFSHLTTLSHLNVVDRKIESWFSLLLAESAAKFESFASKLHVVPIKSDNDWRSSSCAGSGRGSWYQRGGIW